MIYQLSICIGSYNKFLNIELSNNVHSSIHNIMKLYFMLKKKSFNDEYLLRVKEQTKITLELLKNTYSVYSPSNMKYPKFHKTLHYLYFMKLYGCCSLTDVATLKNSIKIHQRNHIKQRTNKISFHNNKCLKG